MSAVCRACKGALVSGTEMRLETCVSCIQAKMHDHEEACQERDRLRAENDAFKKKIESYLLAVAEQEKIVTSQAEGNEARRRGASLDENPYDPDSDPAGSWSYGWILEDMEVRMSLAQHSMKWILLQLSVIFQLARGGASGDEVAEKIQSIVEKIAPHVTE